MLVDSRFCQIDGCEGELDYSNEEDGEEVSCSNCGAVYIKHVTISFDLVSAEEKA